MKKKEEKSLFEIVDRPTKRLRQGLHTPAILEMFEQLKTLPENRALRRGFTLSGEAKSFYMSAYVAVVKKGFKDQVMLSFSRMAEDDGKFYVYVAQRPEPEDE